MIISDLYIATEVVVLSLSHSIAINPGYSSISLEHGSSRRATTKTKTKILDGTEKERERERERIVYGSVLTLRLANTEQMHEWAKMRMLVGDGL